MKNTFSAILALLLAAHCKCNDNPNIIFLLADDLGFADVGYHDPHVISPNIDELAQTGIDLEQNYMQPMCTPSRAALMTGMYPYHIGRQQYVIEPTTPTGLTMNSTLLPQRLKTLGYDTHLVGKWHLGFCNEQYLPTNRGFDTHYGFWEGAEDYYTKVHYPFYFGRKLKIFSVSNIKNKLFIFICLVPT